MQRKEASMLFKLLAAIPIVTILVAWISSDFSLTGVSGSGSCAYAEEEEKEPQKGEGKKAQETEPQKRQRKTKALLEEISKAIEKYSDTNFEGTDVVIQKNRADALEELTKKFEGREISVALPIENVVSATNSYSGVQEFRSGAKTAIRLFGWPGFSLAVLKPTISARNKETGKSIEMKPLQSTLGYIIRTGDIDLPADDSLRAITVKLAKEDALRIDDKWTLEISGTIQLNGGGLPRSGVKGKGSSKTRSGVRYGDKGT